MPNLFPVFDVPQMPREPTVQNVSHCRSAYFDFYLGDFIIAGDGRLVAASQEETWQQWCLKVVNTERNALLCYGPRIGTELEAAFAKPARKAQESAIEKTITEALLADPLARTALVNNFTHVWGSDHLTTTFTVTSSDNTTAVLTAKLKL